MRTSENGSIESVNMALDFDVKVLPYMIDETRIESMTTTLDYRIPCSHYICIIIKSNVFICVVFKECRYKSWEYGDRRIFYNYRQLVEVTVAG